MVVMTINMNNNNKILHKLSKNMKSFNKIGNNRNKLTLYVREKNTEKTPLYVRRKPR